MEKSNSLRNLEANKQKLLEAQGHIWHHMFSFINSMCLKCAIQLEIPDIIQTHNKPMTLSQLIEKLPIRRNKSQFLNRIMRVLVNSGFFALQQVCESDHDDQTEQGYVLTDASKLLVKDCPFCVIPHFLLAIDSITTKPYDYLSTWLQNDDRTPFETAQGMKVWEHVESDPIYASLFNEAMASDSRLIASVLIDKGKSLFEGLESLVDVGGGTGTVARAIAAAFPHIECTVLDQPHVVADLRTSKSLKFVGGNMFDAIPPANAVLLKWILHNWSDEESMKILKRCKEAVTCQGNKTGKVIIIDMVLENDKKDCDKRSYQTKLFLDMTMMKSHTGKEREEIEWAKLFSEAGFSHYKISPIIGLRSLIEVYP